MLLSAGQQSVVAPQSSPTGTHGRVVEQTAGRGPVPSGSMQ